MSSPERDPIQIPIQQESTELPITVRRVARGIIGITIDIAKGNIDLQKADVMRVSLAHDGERAAFDEQTLIPEEKHPPQIQDRADKLTGMPEQTIDHRIRNSHES